MKAFLTVLMLVFVLRIVTATAQITETNLTIDDLLSDDFFGVSVAIDQNYAIIGASQATSITGSGAAYLFRNDGGTWIEDQKIIAPDGIAGDRFGSAVAIDESRVVVGAPNHNNLTGAAYIFQHDPVGGWMLQEILTAGDGMTNDQFGMSVSLSGNFAVVGASSHNEGRGAAYVFTVSDTGWTQEAKVTASDGQPQDYFAVSVSVSGEYVIVGASDQDERGLNAGAAYIYRRDGETWTEHQKLLASNGGNGDRFGGSVSIDGDVAIVGAHSYKNELHTEVGAAYIYRRSVEGWIQEQILFASEANLWDQFGVAVSISGDCAIVGVMQDDDNGMDSGSAYIFTREEEHWSRLVKLGASDGTANDYFGSAVSIVGDFSVVGATGLFNTRGAAYVFEGFIPQVELIGDPNGDGAINVLDMLAIANNIMGIVLLNENQLAMADCNGDGNVNVLDMIAIANVIIGVFEECPGAGSSVEISPEVLEIFESLAVYLAPEHFDRLMTLVREVRIPETFTLAQNHPNPFNPTTSIQYSVVSDQTADRFPRVTLKVYNLLGQEMKTLVEDIQGPGYYTVTWDGRDTLGNEVVSGIYFYNLTAGAYTQTRKMVMLK